MSGLFISFEGSEGCGKSTQIEALAARLRSDGLDVLQAREPGGTPSARRSVNYSSMTMPATGCSWKQSFCSCRSPCPDCPRKTPPRAGSRKSRTLRSLRRLYHRLSRRRPWLEPHKCSRRQPSRHRRPPARPHHPHRLTRRHRTPTRPATSQRPTGPHGTRRRRILRGCPARLPRTRQS